MTVHALFKDDFLAVLKAQVDVHHSIYPHLPPQGIYFEALVEKAFKDARIPFTRVEAGNPNAPRHDLMVGNDKISLKTETGQGTKRSQISITKLCTTEREPWNAPTLVGHAMAHLARYEHMLMLRAVWNEPLIHYQLVDVPISLLRGIETADIPPLVDERDLAAWVATFTTNPVWLSTFISTAPTGSVKFATSPSTDAIFFGLGTSKLLRIHSHRSDFRNTSQ